MTDLQPLTVTYVHDRAARHELSPVTAKGVRWVLASFAASCPRSPKKVRPVHVETWLTDQHVAPGTLRSRLSSVRTFCRWCVAHDYMRADPTVGVDGPRSPRSVPRALPAEYVGRLLSCAPDERARLVVCLMVEEGLRRAEVARLRVEDVDFRRRTMLVSGKGARERLLPLTATTWQALTDYLSIFPTTTGPLVRSYHRSRHGITPDHVGRLVSDWMHACGVKKRAWDGVSAHALRHTAASDVLEGGAHIRDVQAMLGHASLATTEVYLRRSDAVRLRAVMDGRTYSHPVFQVVK